ncbi:putative protein-glutamine gamma-glutamyltransferase K [Sesbania bispinosa]|nr:putative protein-glutamine gamma-glutamyltransferase K [Sesbania bispinosa]
MDSMVFSAGTGFHTDVPPKPPDTSGGGTERPSFKDKVIGDRGKESMKIQRDLGRNDHNKGNKFIPLSENNLDMQHVETIAPAQDPGPTTNGPTSPTQPKIWHRKRPRKDPVVGGPIIKDANNSPTPSNAIERGKGKVAIQAQKTNTVKTTMIGNIKVFDLGGGIKSAMPLKRMEGSKLILDDTEDQQTCPQIQHGSKDEEAMEHEDKSKEDNADFDRGPSIEDMLTT